MGQRKRISTVALMHLALNQFYIHHEWEIIHERQ